MHPPTQPPIHPRSRTHTRPPPPTNQPLGVVESVGDWTTITRRDGGEAKKRSVVVRDPSARSIEVTLWGDMATGLGDTIQQASGRARGAVPWLA